MEDPAEQLIRRAVGRRPPPEPGPRLVDGVMRRVGARRAAARPGARRWLAAGSWLATGLACAAALARVPWSGPAGALAWALALVLVPLTYSAALWPERLLALLAPGAGPAAGEPAAPRDPCLRG